MAMVTVTATMATGTMMKTRKNQEFSGGYSERVEKNIHILIQAEAGTNLFSNSL